MACRIGRLNENLRRQRVIFKNEYELAEKDRARAKKLQESHLISDADLEKSEAIRFQQQRQMEQADASIIQNGITIQQHKSQVADLQLAKSDNETNKNLTITEDIHRLQTAIDEWKKQFLIIAPVGGQVSLTKVWSSDLPITAGDEILVIIQNKTGENAAKPTNSIIAKGEVPAIDVEKLQKGMRSSINLDGFVPMKTGSLDAEVMDIALIPQKEAYQIDLALPVPMVTDAGQTIGFRSEMSGEARIFCSEKSALQRILEQGYSMLFQH